MLKYLNDLDTKKPRLNNLAMLPGFNIIEQAKPKEDLNNDTYNKDTSNKTIISENMFSKLYGLIDNVKKQFTRKVLKKAQAQSTRKQSRATLKSATLKSATETTTSASTTRKHGKKRNKSI